MNGTRNREFSGRGNSVVRVSGRLVFGVLLAGMLAACLGGAIRSARAASPAKTTMDGVYTDDQAKRGKDQYTTTCSGCHMEDLSGSGQALPLAGDAFTQVWDGQTVADLLNLIQTTMPQDKPGTLTPEASLDVISYLLQFNQFPAGKEELKNDPDALKNIIITRKAAPEGH